MYWEEDNQLQQFVVPEDVVDVLYSIRCPTLPMDHAWSLSREVSKILPWFADEPRAGLHIIHGADSGNGWERPQDGSELLHLPRRAKLILRLPRGRIADAAALSGQTLEPAGHPMTVGDAKTRPLSTTNILYSRYIVEEPGWDEEAFVGWAVETLRGLGLRFKKVLAGKSASLTTPDGAVGTRSLMIGDLPYEDAVTLQEEGLGPLRTMGCGLFLQQKGF